MVFSPDTLKGVLDSQLTGGPAQACHYSTIISPPPVMGNLGGGLGTAFGYGVTVALSVMIEESEIPGRQFATTPFIMYGTSVKMPFGVVYDDLTLTFIATNNMVERLFFDEWQRCISDPTNNYFNYYDDYVTDINIIKTKPEGDSLLGIPTYLVTIEEAYPIAIQKQELSYAAENYMKLSVTFAYRRWRNIWDKTVGGGLANVSSGAGSFNPFSGTGPGSPVDNFGGLQDMFGLNRTVQNVPES